MRRAAKAKTIEPKLGASGGLVEFNVGLMKPTTADVRISGSTVAQWQFALIEDEAPPIGLWAIRPRCRAGAASGI